MNAAGRTAFTLRPAISQSLPTRVCHRPASSTASAKWPPSSKSRVLRWSLFGFGTGTAAAASNSTLETAAEYIPQISPDLLPWLLALIVAARDDEDGNGGSNNQQRPLRPYTVDEMPGKGKGATASRYIARGEVIISERPLLVWPSQLDASRARELIDGLTEPARKAYLSLANASEPGSNLDPILGIRATNGFSVELPSLPDKLVPATLLAPRPSVASFIFPDIARINHSCAPCADHSIDWSKLKMTVYATTDIPSGSEITIEYMPALLQMSRDERRRVLKRDFGFICQCQVCSLQGQDLEKSDSRRNEIDTIVGVLGDGQLSRAQMWLALEKLESVIAEEGYKAMPEFDNAKVSTAYVGYLSIKRQKAESGNTAS